MNKQEIMNELPTFTTPHNGTARLYEKTSGDITLIDCALFMSNYDLYIKYFGEEVLSKAIEGMPLYYIRDYEYVPYMSGGIDYYLKNYPLCHKELHNVYITEYNGEWSRKVDKLCYEFSIPSKYNTNEDKILRNCLLLKFSYLNQLNPSVISVYHLEREDSEIYIQTEEKKVSLYVPIKALIENDFSIIEKRIETYWKWYYVKPENKEYLDKQLNGLNSSIAIWLKTILNKNK